MYVQFTQAHRYDGPAGTEPHAAVPRRIYQVGDRVDLPADYFERVLEPYGFAAAVTQAQVTKESASKATEGLTKLTVEDLRQRAEDAGLLETIQGTGAGGRVLKDDLVAALAAHANTRAAELEQLPLEELQQRAEDAGLLEDLVGTGPDGEAVKADLVAALVELAAETTE